MSQIQTPVLSRVERTAVEVSMFDALYAPTEKLPAISVPNFPALGRLAAMRFIEWAQDHPEGVVSLPTGRTPEHFIHTVVDTMENWGAPETRAALEASGVDPARRPDLRGLRFVQIDEFYPIDPTQSNSFYHYVTTYYLGRFGLDPHRALLIDCSSVGLDHGETLATVWPDYGIDLSLRYRNPATDLERTQQRVIERIDQWCQDYESRIRAIGGVGFFLGGIGPDGHIGFNVRGSDHHSATRLAPTNYETQAAAATDLGGIETARQRLVITIGLGTITWNPECVAIILAAGAAKAGVVADAIQHEPSVRYPATALQSLSAARFYVTRGAAGRLEQRRLHAVAREERSSDADVERALVDLSVRTSKPLVELTDSDVVGDAFARAVLARRDETREQLATAVRDRLIERIQAGMAPRTDTTFLHTEPHHDDVMLGELPYVVRHTRKASNPTEFVTMTSGFTSVSNAYMLGQLARLSRFLESVELPPMWAEGYFDPRDPVGRQRDVWQYLDGVAADRAAMRDEGIARRLLRNILDVWGRTELDGVRQRVAALRRDFETAYPGRKDPPDVQRLKGGCREFEAECLWGYFGWNCDRVHHLRLPFYKGALFAEKPTIEGDVARVLDLLDRVRPDVVSLALDPEASGPDTHYKVLQATTEAIRLHVEKTGRHHIRVIGYRNVWYRFHPAEANVYVPVTLNMFSILQNAFLNAFVSQRDASFPSHEHDGPFSELAQKIQVEQYQALKSCLGRAWFYEHPSALIRATRGLVFLKEMSVDELIDQSRALRRRTEAAE
jgi:glucosamine-6-phosphate deaminase